MIINDKLKNTLKFSSVFSWEKSSYWLIWRPQKVLHTHWPGIYSPNTSLVNFYYDSYHNIWSCQSFMYLERLRLHIILRGFHFQFQSNLSPYNLERLRLKSATVGNLIAFELLSILGSFWKQIWLAGIR